MVTGAWRASSSGDESRRQHSSSGAMTAGSGGRAAAQPTSNSNNAGLLLKGFCPFLFTFTIRSRTFGDIETFFVDLPVT